MSKKLLGFLLVVVVLGVLALCTTVAIGFFSAYGKRSVPRKVLLEADFEQSIEEYVPETSIPQALGEAPTTTRDVIDALDRAAKDDRVAGLVARIGEAPMGLAQVQDIRDAVIRFRKSGKPTFAWSETFGEFGVGN